MDSRPRPEHTRLDYSDAGPGDATEPGSKLLRSNQQSRVSCFARSADFKLGQQVAAESPAIACSSHQISMVAAAITTPVTNAAKHENSRRSFSTPVMAASPKMRASPVGVSSPRRPQRTPVPWQKNGETSVTVILEYWRANTGAPSRNRLIFPRLPRRRAWRPVGSAPFSTSSRTQREPASTPKKPERHCEKEGERERAHNKMHDQPPSWDKHAEGEVGHPRRNTPRAGRARW